MKKTLTAGLLVVAVVMLTGCASETLEERVENKRICQESGGVYTETISGWTYEYSGWNCDLSEQR